MTTLNRTETAVLTAIDKSPLATDITGKFISLDILRLQFGTTRLPDVEKAIQKLLLADLIEIVEDNDGLYRLTPYGQLQINQQSQSSTTISNISNSNIVNQSTNVQQEIKVSEQTQDVQEKLKELQKAAMKRDTLGMKSAFAYVADKSIDVAIAIVTGMLIK